MSQNRRRAHSHSLLFNKTGDVHELHCVPTSDGARAQVGLPYLEVLGATHAGAEAVERGLHGRWEVVLLARQRMNSEVHS